MSKKCNIHKVSLSLTKLLLILMKHARHDTTHHLSSKARISLKFFPFVSGRKIKMNKAPTSELRAKRNIVPCIPKISISDDKYWKELAVSFLSITREWKSSHLDSDECKYPQKRHAKNRHKSSYLESRFMIGILNHYSLSDYLGVGYFAENHKWQRH